MLLQPFSRKNISKALKAMHPTKAPCYDVIPPLFYQKYWDIVANDVVRICLKVLNDGVSVESINRTIISLIPKVKAPKRINEFRPISLCMVLYKLVLNYLANILKICLDSTISECLSVFIGGRLIHDNVVVGFEESILCGKIVLETGENWRLN